MAKLVSGCYLHLTEDLYLYVVRDAAVGGKSTTREIKLREDDPRPPREMDWSSAKEGIKDGGPSRSSAGCAACPLPLFVKL